MPKSKEEIMRKALLEILARSMHGTAYKIAYEALQEAKCLKRYRIEAKTWYSKTALSNSMFKVVLLDDDSGEILLKLQGYDPGGWPIRMAHLMETQMPNAFPQRKSQLCSIWFRETLGIEVIETEVPLKRNLGL